MVNVMWQKEKRQRITAEEALRKGKTEGRCVKCDKLVRAIPAAKNKVKKRAAYIRHLRRNPDC